jgi:ABC-type sugar transport system permease subunit
LLAVVMGIALALLGDRQVRGVGFFRSVAYLPIVISLTIVSIVWALIYAFEGGLLNGVFRAVGLPPQPFLTSAQQALPSVMAMHIWHGAGYYMVLFLAGLQGIPDVYYEAARIDGATRLAAFRFITLPLLRHVILFVVVFGTVGYINTFAPVYLMTRGGPQGSTTLLSYLIYQQVFVYLRLGYGSAMAVVLIVTVLSLVLVELRLFRSGREF